MMKRDRRDIARQVRQAAPPDRPSMVTNRVSSRILIVDDNTDLAEAMSTVLTICGFDTTTAYNGRLALEKARTFRPEVVLLDIGLPDMDGYEVASTIRRDCGLEAAVFIAMSANERDPSAPQVEEARFHFFLLKPVDLDLLLQLLSGPGHWSDSS